MDNKTLLIGFTAAGIGYYIYSRHLQAQRQISMQPMVQPVPGTSAALPAVVPDYGAPIPVAQAPFIAPVPPHPSQTSQPTVAQMTNALLDQWATVCKNPPVVVEMIGMLTDSEIAGLYNMLTTQWEVGKPATADSTAFWNQLRIKYPCLNSSGAGCTSPTNCS